MKKAIIILLAIFTVLTLLAASGCQYIAEDETSGDPSEKTRTSDYDASITETPRITEAESSTYTPSINVRDRLDFLGIYERGVIKYEAINISDKDPYVITDNPRDSYEIFCARCAIMDGINSDISATVNFTAYIPGEYTIVISARDETYPVQKFIVTVLDEGEEEVISNASYALTRRMAYTYYSPYMYYIKDSDGKILLGDRDRLTFPTNSSFSFLTDDILKITSGTGTGNDFQYTYYYNLKKLSETEEWYKTDEYSSSDIFSVFDETDSLVVWAYDNKVVVRNMFGEQSSRTIKHIKTFEKPLSVVDYDIPFTEIKFLDNGHNLSVTYLYGENFEEYTEIFNLDDIPFLDQIKDSEW